MMSRGRRPDRFLATILFTDIVGSTDLAVQLGDRDWRRLVAAHHAAVRRQLRRFGGHEHDTAGDGFFASFDQPAQAVRAANEIVSEVAALGVAVRAGVHTGECERVGDKVGGVAVHIAARVMAAAATEEVLVSSTVRDLVPGSGLEFEDRGVRELKGVPGEWHLFALQRETRIPTDRAAAHRAAIAGVASLETRGRRRRLVAGAAIALVAAVVGTGALVYLLGAGTPPVLAAPGPNSLVTIDGASGRILEVREAPVGPHALVTDGERLWVAALDAGVLSSLPMSGTAAQSTSGRVGRPTGLAVGGAYLWVADAFAQSLALVDPGSGSVTRAVEMAARNITFGFDSAWVTDDMTDRVLRLDRQSASVLAVIELPDGAYPSSIAVGADSIWVASPGTQSVARIDPSTNSATNVAIPLRAVPTALSAGDSELWIASRGSDSLLRLDPATNAVNLTVDAICDQPSAVIVDRDSVWVACSATTPEVVRVSLDGEVVGRISLAGVPTAFAADDGRIYVTVRAP